MDRTNFGSPENCSMTEILENNMYPLFAALFDDESKTPSGHAARHPPNHIRADARETYRRCHKLDQQRF